MKKSGILIVFGFIAALAVLITVFAETPQIITNGPTDELVAGRNVNMVSGTKLPWGDPWLQRQNEPSIAVSTRNPLHLVAGANDYRTVDIPDPRPLPGIPPGVAAGDAWGGLFMSLDGGQSWLTTVLPGYPQDLSLQGTSSPINGFDAVCDPCVRSGANGMFFYSGIAFIRSGGAGAVFVSRFIDNNNFERIIKDWDDENDKWQWTIKPENNPIKYIDTRIVDLGNPGQFIDMASIAVDVPRGNPGTQSIQGWNVPNMSIYSAYTTFLGVSAQDNVRCRLMFAKSADSGTVWGKPIKLSEGWHIIQRPTIVIDPGDPTGNTIYVTFRRFAHGTTPGGIGIVKSVDGGLSFTKPIEVATLLYPFDQGMTENRFRTNSYPATAVDGNGCVHVAWAERRDPGSPYLPDPNGQARIVISTSTDGGFTWGAPQVVEPYHAEYSPIPGEPTYPAGLNGHQFMPSLAYAGGKLMLSWYDQRGSIAKQVAPSSCVGLYVEDMPGAYRQTVDVRAAEGIPGVAPLFLPSQQVSRYLFYLNYEPNVDTPDTGYFDVVQGEYNPVNVPLFDLGSRPFHGDYMDMAASPQILPPPLAPFAGAGSAWSFNTRADLPTNFQAAWTDNRDVRPSSVSNSPNQMWGDWGTYFPPYSPQDFGNETPANTLSTCAFPDHTGKRNQNVYTASLSKGIIVGSPGNTKQLNENRAFVVFVKNLTPSDRFFELSFDPAINADASFEQFASKASLSVAVGGNSSASLTVYVPQNSTDLFAPVKVDVREDLPGNPLVGYVLLNPDGTNPEVEDPNQDQDFKNGYEKHQPHVGNPKVWKYYFGSDNEPHAGTVNPRVQNPRVQNTGHVNPRVQNPRVQNPRVQNNTVKNENLVNQATANPRVQNPRVQNTALTDMTWEVTNSGNTTSAYTFDVIADEIGDLNTYFQNGYLYGQVLVYKIHTTPADAGCELGLEHADELLVNITNPRVQNPRVQNTAPGTMSLYAAADDGSGIELDDPTFHLAPGETAYVTLRVYDPDLQDGVDFDIQAVAAEVAADAADTGETAPKFAPQDDLPWDPDYAPPLIVASPPLLQLSDTSATYPLVVTLLNPPPDGLPYVVTSDVEWLSVSPSSGILASSPETVGVEIDADKLGPAGAHYGNITVVVPLAYPLRIPVYFTASGLSPVISVEYEDAGSGTILNGGTYAFSNQSVPSSWDETFLIQNGGNTDLILGGKPMIRVLGDDADQFRVLTDGWPDSVIPAGDSTSFTIRFQPTSTGMKSATVSIMNNDADENPFIFQIQGTGVSTPGLVAYYPFNGNADDESGNGNHGTPYGSPDYASDRFGNPGGAIDLDGLDDYIELPNESDFDLTEWTMIMTLKVQDYTKTESVISKGNTSWGNYTLDIIQQDAPSPINVGKFGFVVDPVGSGTNWSHLVTRDPVPIDQYFQVAVTYDPSELNTYLNGENEYTYPDFPLPELNDDPVSIGSQRWLGHFFKGQIDEIRIYNYVLSPAEIAALYSTDQGLVAYYPFNGNADDESGNGNHGTPYGSPDYASDRFGNPGGAIDLDGLDDYIELPNESDFDLTEWTMVMTVKVQDYTKTESVISKGNTSWGNYTLDIVQADAPDPTNIGKFGFVVDPLGSGTNWSHLVTRNPVPIDQYFQVAVSYDPSELNTYLNGENEYTYPEFPLPELNDDPVSIGSQRWLGHFFKGQIDEIRIYHRTLTPTEIQVLYSLR